MTGAAADLASDHCRWNDDTNTMRSKPAIIRQFGSFAHGRICAEFNITKAGSSYISHNNRMSIIIFIPENLQNGSF